MTLTDTALVPSGIDPDVSAALQIYERIKPLKDALGVRDLTDGELQVFAYVARFTGLDPFTKQIYAIKRGGRVTHQTGIDGYRSAAERSGQYAGSDETTFEDCDCGQDPANHPKLARTVVHRILANGHVVDQVGIARWHELYPGAGEVGSMWRKMPHNQLAKCSEANGLRKAFPRVLGGVYIAEEMQGGDVIEGEAREVPAKPPPVTVADRIAARRAEREAPANDPTPQEAASEPVSEREVAAEMDAPVGESAAAPTQESVVAEGECGNGSPFGDGGFCGLPAGHAGKYHRQLGIEGAVTGSWPTT